MLRRVLGKKAPLELPPGLGIELRLRQREVAAQRVGPVRPGVIPIDVQPAGERCSPERGAGGLRIRWKDQPLKLFLIGAQGGHQTPTASRRSARGERRDSTEISSSG